MKRIILCIINLLLLTSFVLAQEKIDNTVDPPTITFPGRINANILGVTTACHIYGGYEDSTSTLPLTQNQWAMMTNDAGDLLIEQEGTDLSISNDSLIVHAIGHFEGILVVTFSGSNGNEYQFRIADGAQQGYKQGVTAGGAGNYVQCILPIFISNSVPDTKYIFQVQNITGDNSITFRHAQFIVLYTHD